MFNLMKYEFRKTAFSKVVILAITVIAEIAYLAGVFGKWEKTMAIGITGLAMCALIGIFYIGIESLLVFHKDLNTKQSYMLFLTPKNSYQILGAKVLENGIAIFVTGAFFAVLAAVDMTIGILYIGGVKEFLNVVEQVLHSIQVEIELTPQTVLFPFFAGLASWLMTIVTGYLAIVLSATVLAGKKFSGLVSFILFMVLTYVSGLLLDHLPVLGSNEANACLMIASSFVIIAIMYALTGWVMEKKLSV